MGRATRGAQSDNRSRTRTRAERYEEILGAAAHVFAKKGYRAATIQDIAGELQVTGAALYHYVGGKEDLLVDICARAGNRLHDEAKSIMASELPPVEKLRAFFRRHLELIEADRPIFGILIQERSELPPHRVDELLEGERAYLATVRRLLVELDGSGFDVRDPRLASYAMIGMLNWALRWHRQDGAYGVEEVADGFYRIFVHGIGPDSSEPTAPA